MVITPGDHPLEELAIRLSALGGLEPRAVRESLAASPGDAHLLVASAVLTYSRRHGLTDSDRVVLVVGQFEDVFLKVTSDERQKLVRALAAAARAPALVVLGIRGDFLGDCGAHRELAEAFENGQFLVGPMEESELSLAIRGPAAAAGLDLEAGLVETVLADLRSHADRTGFGVGALPLLSQAMLLTWTHREGTTLTIRGYARSGKVTGAVQVAADDAYAALRSQQADITREVFLRLAVQGPGGRPARRRLLRAELYGRHPRRLVDRWIVQRDTSDDLLGHGHGLIVGCRVTQHDHQGDHAGKLLARVSWRAGARSSFK